MEEFNTKLKEVRKEKGFTQKELGNIVGVSEVMIGQYERGVRTPKVEMRKKLANALGVSLNVFLTNEEYTDEVLEKSIDIGIDNIKAVNQIFISYLESIGITVDIQPTSATPAVYKNNNVIEPKVFYRYEVTGNNTPHVFNENDWAELQNRIAEMVKLLIN